MYRDVWKSVKQISFAPFFLIFAILVFVIPLFKQTVEAAVSVMIMIPTLIIFIMGPTTGFLVPLIYLIKKAILPFKLDVLVQEIILALGVLSISVLIESSLFKNFSLSFVRENALRLCFVYIIGRIFYALMSISWKNRKNKKYGVLAYSISIVLLLISVLTFCGVLMLIHVFMRGNSLD